MKIESPTWKCYYCWEMFEDIKSLKAHALDQHYITGDLIDESLKVCL
jgi:hypothetical protein